MGVPTVLQKISIRRPRGRLSMMRVNSWVKTWLAQRHSPAKRDALFKL